MENQQSETRDRKQFTCTVCSEEFLMNCDLVKHLQTHTKKNSFSCKLCSKTFSQRKNLIRHVNAIHVEKQSFVCYICSKSFSRRDRLKQHLITHEKGKHFICEVCSEGFIKSYDLVKHLRTHMKKNSFSCKVCLETFSKRKNLIRHVNEVHVAEKSFVCDVCSRGFSRRDSLKQHLLTHKKEKPFICDVCSKEFSRKVYLKHHLLRHKEEKHFICDICSRGFYQIDCLKQHLLAHKKEKHFICKVCSKGFDESYDLVKHFQTHTKEKSFSCEVCSETFSASRNLIRHVNAVHVDQKPFVCDVCSKGFSRRDHLKRHLFSHRKEEHFICEVCSEGFIKSCDLEKHCLTHVDETEKTLIKSCDVEEYMTLGEDTDKSWPKYQFICEVCSEGFINSCDLEKHSVIHTEKTYIESCDAGIPLTLSKDTDKSCVKCEFICEVCSEGFINNNDLEKHSLIHTEDTEKTFIESCDAGKPLTLSEDTGKSCVKCEFICEVCSEEFINNNDLEEHSITHTKDTEKTFIEKCYVEEHFTIVKNMTESCEKREFVCEICLEGFSKSNDLEKHLLIHTGITEKSFFKSCDLEQHVSYTENRKFFIESYNLENNAIHLKNTEKSFIETCDLENHAPEKSVIENCELEENVSHAEDTKSFIKSSGLAKNHQIHADEKRSSFVCEFCSKVFTRSNGLIRHIRSIHTNEKPFICAVCSKEFSRSDRLKEHILTHENHISNERLKYLLIDTGITENSFNKSCDLEKDVKLGKYTKNMLTESCDLGKHVTCSAEKSAIKSSDMNDKRFACRSCSKVFNCSFRLKRHILIHTKEKPFVCHVCFKEFSRSDNLKKHIGKFH